MMKKITVLVILWIIYVLSDYFYFPYFVQPFCWLFVCLILLILTIRQIVKSIKEKKDIKRSRILKLIVTSILFFLTFYNFNSIPNFIVEKIDWNIYYNKRNDIVADVLIGKLTPNTEMNNGVCELPFKFPIISNGGNDILISENKETNTKTVHFWISRGFFDAPQTYFIYTNDNELKKQFEKQIKSKPEYNWKLEENWYRIMERD